jgi:hypothetical protein
MAAAYASAFPPCLCRHKEYRLRRKRRCDGDGAEEPALVAPGGPGTCERRDHSDKDAQASKPQLHRVSLTLVRLEAAGLGESSIGSGHTAGKKALVAGDSRAGGEDTPAMSSEAAASVARCGHQPLRPYLSLGLQRALHYTHA